MNKPDSSPKKLPVVLILRRRALRIFPNNIIVGLYKSEQLDKWISVPYSGVGISEEIQKDLDQLIEDLDNKDKGLLSD